MSNPRAGTVTINRASADEQDQALAMIFRGLVEEDQLGRVGEILGVGSEEAADGLLVARRNDCPVGAVYSQTQPGKVALVWFPRLLPAEPLSTAVGLLTATCRLLVRRGVQIAQCLLRTSTTADRAILNKAEFEPLAKLFYMVSQESDFPQSSPVTPLQFEPYSSENHHRLAKIVEATYQQTLDCPRLNGVRAVEDVLAGYRCSGVFDPQRWLIVRQQQRDVGCLLLTDYPDQGNWELIYMGILPECRGQSWGAAVARHAQWLAHQAGRPRLVLAVDAGNGPAIRLYSAQGFRAFDRRDVYWKVLATA